MSVRRQCNRYRNPPSGRDVIDVIKRGKAWSLGNPFMVSEYNGVYSASEIPAPCFSLPASARLFVKRGRFWAEVNDRDHVK